MFREHSRLTNLFSVLDAENQPSDEAQESAIGGKGLKAARSDLRRLILKAMRNFHEENNPKAELQSALLDIDFLRSKQLYGEAEKEFRKALKKAEAQLDDQAQFALLMKSIEFYRTYKSSDDLHAEYSDIRRRLTQLSTQLKSNGNLFSISSEWGRYVTKFDQRELRRQQEYFDLQLSPEIEVFRNADLTPRSQLVLNNLDIHYRAMFLKDDPNTDLIQNTIRLYEQEPELKQLYFPLYFSTLYNYSSALYQADGYEESLAIIITLTADFQIACGQTDQIYPTELRFRHRYAILSGRLRALCGLNRHLEALELVEEHEQLKANGTITPNLTTALLIILRIASVHFHLGQYKKSLSFTAELLQHDGVKNIHEIYLIGLYAEALCVYMLGDIDLAESRFTNLSRLIMAAGNSAGVTAMQLKFIRTAAQTDFMSKSGREIATALKTALLAEKSDNFWYEFIAPAVWLQQMLAVKNASGAV